MKGFLKYTGYLRIPGSGVWRLTRREVSPKTQPHDQSPGPNPTLLQRQGDLSALCRRRRHHIHHRCGRALPVDRFRAEYLPRAHPLLLRRHDRRLYINRYFTFHHLETGRKLWHSLLRHYSVHSIGGFFNYGVYLVVLVAGQKLGGQLHASASLPFVAVWIGGLVGLCFNFVFSKKLVFDN